MTYVYTIYTSVFAFAAQAFCIWKTSLDFFSLDSWSLRRLRFPNARSLFFPVAKGYYHCFTFHPTQWWTVFERWPCYMKSNVLNVEFLDHKILDLYFHHRFKGRYFTPKRRNGQQRAGVWKWDVDPTKTSIPLLDVMEKWIWAGDL